MTKGAQAREVSVPKADELSRGTFLRFEVSDGIIKQDVRMLTEKAAQCRSESGCEDIHEAVLQADKEQEIRLFLDALKDVSEKLRDVEPLIEAFVDDLKSVFGELLREDIEDADKKRLQEVVDRMMVRFAKLGIGYKAEKTEKTFGLYNAEYLKTSLARRIADGFLENKFESKESLNYLGLLFIDLDGLKSINELSIGKYAAGDRALQIVADILSDEKFKKWSEKMGMELLPAHYHGDEFLMMVDGMAGNVDLADNELVFTGINGREVNGISIMKYIGEYIREAVKNAEEEKIKEIFDFENEEQSELLSDFRKLLTEEERNFFDNGFKYQLSCSYGYATVQDALVKIRKEGVAEEMKEWSFMKAVVKIAGFGLIDTAATKLGIAKKLGKSERKNSENIRDRILEKFYRFVRERRADSIPVEDAQSIMEVLFQFRDELREIKVRLKQTERQLSIAERREKARDEVIKLNARMAGQVRRDERLTEDRERRQEEYAKAYDEAWETAKQIKNLEESIRLLQGRNEEVVEQLKRVIESLKGMNID